MELEQKLKEAIARQQKIVSQLEALEQQKQDLLQEVLRGDGEVRTLKALIEEEEVKQ